MNVGKSMPFVDNCYLLKHAQGWMMWDTGLTDALAAKPEGQKPDDPCSTHWYRPKTLASQLEQLGASLPTSSSSPFRTRIRTIAAMSNYSRN